MIALKAVTHNALTLLWQIQSLHEHTIQTLKSSPPTFSFLSPSVPERYSGSDVDWFSENLIATNDAQILQVLEVQSTFAIAFAAMEFGLSQLAQEILNFEKVNLELRDINENGIKRAKTILRRIGGLNNCFLTPEWSLLLECERIRNVVMHGGGLVEQGTDRHNELAKIPGVETRSFSKSADRLMIAISPERLKVYLLAFSQFLVQVLTELEMKHAHA